MAGTDPTAGEPDSARRQRPGAGNDSARQLAKALLEADIRENTRQSSLWDSLRQLWQRIRGRLSAPGGESAEGRPAAPSAAGPVQGGGPAAPSAREAVDKLSKEEREPVRAAMVELIQGNTAYQDLYFAGRLPEVEALLDGPDPQDRTAAGGPGAQNPAEARAEAQARAQAGTQARAQAPPPGGPPVARSQTWAAPGAAQPPIMVQAGSHSPITVVVNNAPAPGSGQQAPLPAMPTTQARHSLDAVGPGRRQPPSSASDSSATPPAKRPAAAPASPRPAKRIRAR